MRSVVCALSVLCWVVSFVQAEPVEVPNHSLDDVRPDVSSVRPGRSFYVDGISGNDSNKGMSPEGAWASLAPFNSMIFMPGDRILFKAGTSYTGLLKPQGRGSKGAPIIIDMYGSGDKPRIDGKGILDTVLLKNIEYWEVNNLEVTNLGATLQKWRTGVKVLADSCGTLHHIHLKNLYVHDVNGSLDKKTEGCGIFTQARGSLKSRFDGLLIENCHVLRTDRNGICMRSSFTNRSRNWFPSLNVVIRNNFVEDCGGDCIKPWGCDGCLVENNVVKGGRRRCEDYAAGIWPWSSDNTIIQYNEVSGMKGTKDGQAFDSDYNCRNSLFQYNYSHDNDGGFMLVCSPDTSPSNIGTLNTVIRYNISQNDGSDSRIFHISGGGVKDTHIYNNVIYVGSKLDNTMLLFYNWGDEWPVNTCFRNNIFYVDGRVDYDLGKGVNTVFENNVFYGNHVSIPAGKNTITSSPDFVSPGSGADGRDTLQGYKLRAGSVCVEAGVGVVDNGGFDFWGNLIHPGKNPDIGVHAYTHQIRQGSDVDNVDTRGTLF
jgi:hypothetical protein